MPSSLRIIDVTLRDGLQSQSQQLTLEQKVSLYEKLRGCGFSRVEVTSFVNPQKIPQFADADEFCTLISKTKTAADPEWMAFVPNRRGIERLERYPIEWAAAFISTSDTFNKKNVNQTSSELLVELKAMKAIAQAAKRKFRIYVSTVFGCPYEGDLPLQKTLEVIKAVADLQPDELALSDTIGVATADQIRAVGGEVLKWLPKERVAFHLHNTYGLALSSLQAAFELGFRHFDGATGGLGGCPYAKGASGNMPSEEILFSFSRQKHIQTNFSALREAILFLTQRLGLVTSSHLAEILHKGGDWYGVTSRASD